MKSEERLKNYSLKHRKLLDSLSRIGFTWPGTIEARKLKCGKTQCSCQTNPEAKHGPYYYWTTKIKNKTVSKMLSEDEVQTLRRWIQNRKKLEKTLREMKALSQKAASILFKDKVLVGKLSER
jgi:hypothetical protein